MNELLVFGNGWMGNRIASFFQCPISKIRVTNYEDIQKEIDTFHSQVIINCIGHSGKNVDSCDLDKTKALSSLVTAPILLAETAIRNNIKLVHLSSGCIYNYDYWLNRPITETDPPDFHGLYYSRLKIYTEAALTALGKSANILQLRLRMPLDFIPNPRNLLDKLLNLKSVIDIPNSVSYVPDFLESMKHLLKLDAEGIYNTVNYGGLRFRELLEAYRTYDPNHSYAIMELSELKILRTNLILSTDKLEETGFIVRDIHDCLKECIESYFQILRSPNAGQIKQAKI